jgi:glycerol-3-phosphate responsive antiterminator
VKGQINVKRFKKIQLFILDKGSLPVIVRMIPVAKPGAVPWVKGVIERIVKQVMVIDILVWPWVLPEMDFHSPY